MKKFGIFISFCLFISWLLSCTRIGVEPSVSETTAPSAIASPQAGQAISPEYSGKMVPSSTPWHSPSPTSSPVAEQALQSTPSSLANLDAWIGEYEFSEHVPPDENMLYHISIRKEKGEYTTDISVDGFQTRKRLRAKVEGSSDVIQIIFESYLPDNQFEIYQPGQVLLRLEHDGSRLTTYWGEIKSLDPEHQASGEVCFERVPS